jgi:integrase/recombinase XerD
VGSQTKVSQIDRDDVRGYARTLLDSRNLKETTVRRHIATLKVLFRWMEREELIRLSLFHGMDLSIRIPRLLPRALSAEEMCLLLRRTEREPRGLASQIHHDARLMHFVVVALFTTGLRVGELVAVCLADMSERETAILVRGKGRRERRVFLPGREARAVLARYLAARVATCTPIDQLLVTANGVAVTTQYVRKRLRELARSAGIGRRITPHMLRHTAATQLLEAGVDIRFVQTLLGHTSIATTQIYAEVRDTALKARLARANTLARIRRLR